MSIPNVVFTVASFLDPTGISQAVLLFKAGVTLIKTVKEGRDREIELAKLLEGLQSAYDALEDKRRKPGYQLRKAIKGAKENIENSRWDSAAKFLNEASELLAGVSSIPHED
ncbi:hypothetical protein Vafri_12309 [Volvox africanus]|uniref:Uncharacterized protein n=1 Tax=Volvox africanus TaxID=51714 RepID=A0A8J4BA01_9CHLO|nr:hypothetical protein Vafri_12309 [Volvox africanus]